MPLSFFLVLPSVFPPPQVSHYNNTGTKVVWHPKVVGTSLTCPHNQDQNGFSDQHDQDDLWVTKFNTIHWCIWHHFWWKWCHGVLSKGVVKIRVKAGRSSHQTWSNTLIPVANSPVLKLLLSFYHVWEEALEHDSNTSRSDKQVTAPLCPPCNKDKKLKGLHNYHGQWHNQSGWSMASLTCTRVGSPKQLALNRVRKKTSEQKVSFPYHSFEVWESDHTETFNKDRMLWGENGKPGNKPRTPGRATTGFMTTGQPSLVHRPFLVGGMRRGEEGRVWEPNYGQPPAPHNSPNVLHTSSKYAQLQLSAIQVGD